MRNCGSVHGESHGNEGSDALPDGFLMTNGLKNASKCRSCSKTLDVGTPAWFDREGEAGRKVTCQECHTAKHGEAAPAVSQENKLLEKPTKKKQKRTQPRFTPEMLLDPKKGMVPVYKSFPKIKFRGEGHEQEDLHK